MIQWTKPTNLNITFSHSNILPTPHTEISLPEYFQLMYREGECLKGIDFAQVHLPEQERNSIDEKIIWEATIYNCNFFWYNSYGIAVIQTWRDSSKVSNKLQQLPKPNAIEIPFYKDLKVGESSLVAGFRFFHIGCLHSFKESVIDIHTKKYLCTKCAYSYSTDSSG